MTERYDVFLSYNRLDRRMVEPLAQALCERGLRVFKDDWYLRPGEYWPTALEKKLAESAAIAVAIGRNGLGPWQQREAAAALDRQSQASKGDNPVPPVIPVLLEQGSERQAGLAFLLQNTWVEAWDPRAADLIAGAVRGRPPAELYDEAHTDPRTLICPYRGLGVFREEDAGFYFGREPDLERLTRAVELHPIVAIVGASGSGKSSLARAGLIPHLRRQAGERVWQVADMVPGSDPFLALARALLPLREPEQILIWSKGDIDDQCERLGDHLERKGAEHLSYVVEQILKEEPGTKHLMLLVDQWEELYTYRPTESAAAKAHAERVRRFIRMLLEAVRSDTLRAVITLRADYWGEVLNDEPLAARLPDEAIIHLRALDRTALNAIIRSPAEKTMLTVPDALVEALLNDAFGQPGDLALLEFTLQKLWSERVGDPGALTLEAYRAMGGLEKAIVTRADTVYARLDKGQQEAVPGVFAALVQVGELRTDLRRRARLAELSEEGQTVVRQFADERLLVTSRDWHSEEDLVEVAHEALLRHWPKLKEWIDERRGALLTIRQLQADARNWLTRQKSPSYLWSHERVREADSALTQLGAEVVLSDEEKDFLGPVDTDAMLAELDRPDTTHRYRALIGERLNIRGDPRWGVGVCGSQGTPDIDLCAVPGGEVEIQPEGGRRQLDNFYIARYPITVGQYRAFIEAEDGWREPNWWADDLWRDPEGDSHNFGRFSNHPAVYVSWFDAVAFCRWLAARLGLERNDVRLPDEWEWQKAASGGDSARDYPWAPDWDPRREPQRANTIESGLGATTAVGMYPVGASREGVLDMAGTVWEWCLNKFDMPDLSQSRADDSEPRVLRGGSWGLPKDRARCAERLGNPPTYRSGPIGFRVLCSSAIVDR